MFYLLIYRSPKHITNCTVYYINDSYSQMFKIINVVYLNKCYEYIKTKHLKLAEFNLLLYNV